MFGDALKRGEADEPSAQWEEGEETWRRGHVVCDYISLLVGVEQPTQLGTLI